MIINNKLENTILVIFLLPTTIFYFFISPLLLVSAVFILPYTLIFFVGGGFGLLSSWVLIIKNTRNKLHNSSLSKVWLVGNVVTLLVAIYYLSVFVVRLSPSGIAQAESFEMSSKLPHMVISIFPIITSILLTYLISKNANERRKLTFNPKKFSYLNVWLFRKISG